MQAQRVGYFKKTKTKYERNEGWGLRGNGSNNWRIDENEIGMAISSSSSELWLRIIYKKQKPSTVQRSEKAVEIYTRVTGNQVQSGGYFLPFTKQNNWFKEGDDSFLGASIAYVSSPDFECDGNIEVDMAKLHLEMAIRNRSWMHYMSFQSETDWNIYVVEFDEKYWWWVRERAIEFCHSLVNFDYGPPSPTLSPIMFPRYPPQLIHSSMDDDDDYFPSLSGKLVISPPPCDDDDEYYYTPTFQYQ